MEKRSCKGSKCIAVEEKLMDRLDPHQDYSRSARFNRAIETAMSISDEEWLKLCMRLKQFKNTTVNDEEVAIPTAMQVVIENHLEEDLIKVENNIKRALSLTKLQTRYLFEILFLQYIESLESNVFMVNTPSTKHDLTGPEIVKLIVEMLLLNNASDTDKLNRIKEILLEDN